VLDRFGTDIQIFERDEQTFTALFSLPAHETQHRSPID
jgi:hypothetical protein